MQSPFVIELNASTREASSAPLFIPQHTKETNLQQTENQT